jgi:drug/metabolite transporter (DMT)-like permease
MFAFVSPVVALITGAVVLGERIDPLQVFAACVLIGAAAFTVGRDALRGTTQPPASLAE